jgi:hypothetical protein
VYVCSTIYSEARIVIDDSDESSDEGSSDEEQSDSTCENVSCDECEGGGEEKFVVSIGSMVKVVNGWNEDLTNEDESADDESESEVEEDSDPAVRSEVGNECKDKSKCEWFLAKVVEFAPGGWIHVHLWRSYNDKKDKDRVYSPVWLNSKGDKEVYMLNPNSQGGFRNARAWKEWYKPKEVAVLAGAVCEDAPKGVTVKKWCDDFSF